MSLSVIDQGRQISPVEHFQSNLERLFRQRFTDLYVKIDCTLEELYFGCRKEIMFERVELMGDGRTEKFTTVKKEIELRPGMNSYP